MNHSFDFNGKCLGCKIYGKQYIGQTTDPSRDRQNNYKDGITS